MVRGVLAGQCPLVRVRTLTPPRCRQFSVGVHPAAAIASQFVPVTLVRTLFGSALLPADC